MPRWGRFTLARHSGRGESWQKKGRPSRGGPCSTIKTQICILVLCGSVEKFAPVRRIAPSLRYHSARIHVAQALVDPVEAPRFVHRHALVRHALDE
jgi:hypothetical protein